MGTKNSESQRYLVVSSLTSTSCSKTERQTMTALLPQICLTSMNSQTRQKLSQHPHAGRVPIYLTSTFITILATWPISSLQLTATPNHPGLSPIHLTQVAHQSVNMTVFRRVMMNLTLILSKLTTCSKASITQCQCLISHNTESTCCQMEYAMVEVSQISTSHTTLIKLECQMEQQ